MCYTTYLKVELVALNMAYEEMISKIKRFFRIGYFTVVMYVGTHAIVFLLFPIWFVLTLFNPASISKLKELFGKLLFIILHKRIEVTGLDNLDKNKRYLIVANYPSGYAGFVMMMLFPKASVMAHSFMSKVPIISNMLSRNGFIYAHRTGYQKTKHLISQMIERSKSDSIVILPEGRITRDAEIHEFKRGFLLILRQSSLDLLPITLSGFYTLKAFMRPYVDPDTELRVNIHEPIIQDTIRTITDEQLLSAVQNTIEGSYKP